MTSEPAFVGVGRHAVVDGLVAAFDRIRDGGSACWIVLEAPSGWGKTRVLREFYRRLATERQTVPPYWPADILANAGSDDVAARRKRLVPDVTHTPDSLPGYLWWGITCSSRGGSTTAALRHDLGQVEAHAEFLEDAWREVAPSQGWWRSGLKDAGLVAADEAAMEVAGTAVESVLGAAVPGLGLVRWLGERGVAGVRAAAQRRERLASTVRIEASDLVAETAAMLGRLAIPGLPVVIAIEDAHAADPALCDLVAALVASDASILVVSTSWPGVSADNGDLARAVGAAGERVVRLDHRSASAPAPFGPDASLAELDADALTSIVRHDYPEVDDATAAAIVGRYPNPLMLELFCQLPRVRRRGRSGALHLDAETIASAPAQIRGLYQELWNELPEAVREALSLAALGIPSLLDPALTSEWDTDLVLAALAELGWPMLDEIAQALHGDAYAWARSVSAALRTFNEPDQRDIAGTDDSFLFDDDRVEVRTAIGAALGTHLSAHHADADQAERRHLADLAVVLYAEGFLSDPDVLADATRPAAEAMFDDQRDLPQVVAVLTRVIDATPSIDRLARAHLLRGHAHLLAGRLDEALADAEAAVSPDAPELFQIEVLSLRARCSVQRRDGAAVGAYEELAARVERVLGADHPDTIAIRAGLAEALGVAGRGAAAIERMGEVVARAETVLGADDPYALAIRNGFATLLAQHGRIDDALGLFARLDAACRRLLGPDHPRTLIVARNHADTALAADAVADSVAELRTLVDDHHRVFGVDHPDTCRAERLLGRALTHTGDDVLAQEGVDRLTALHERELTVLGRGHPEVQDTLAVLANAAIRSGEHDLALRILRRRLAEVEQVHMRPSMPIATAQSDLGHALAVAGHLDEAVAALGASLIDLIAIDESPSPQHVTIRQLLARTLAESGEGDRALEQLRLVADDATTLWGAMDERTIDARDDIARIHLAAGRRDEALADWERLATEIAAAYGTDDPMLDDLHRLIDDVRSDTPPS